MEIVYGFGFVLFGVLITLFGTVITKRYEKGNNIYNHLKIFIDHRYKVFEEISELLNVLSYYNANSLDFHNAFHDLIKAGKHQYMFNDKFNILWEEMKNCKNPTKGDYEKLLAIVKEMSQSIRAQTGIEEIDKYIKKYTKIKKVKSK